MFQITMVGSHADWGGAFARLNPTKADLSILGAAKGPVEERHAMREILNSSFA